LFDIIFGWQNPCHISNPEIGDIHFILYFYGDTGYEHWKGFHQKSGQNYRLCFVEQGVLTGKLAKLRGFFQLVPQKIETFSIDEIRTLLRGASSSSRAVSDFKVFMLFDTLSCFDILSMRDLKCSKIGHARRMGNFTSEITLNDEYLGPFLSDCKVLWICIQQLVGNFIKLPISDRSQAICVLLGGKIKFVRERFRPRERGKILHKSRKISFFFSIA